MDKPERAIPCPVDEIVEDLIASMSLREKWVCRLDTAYVEPYMIAELKDGNFFYHAVPGAALRIAVTATGKIKRIV